MELRREDEVLGTSEVAGDLEAANELSFAGAVANETMRLRPVAPVLILRANVETVVGDKFACCPVRWRAIPITSPSPMPSGPAAGSAKPPARMTHPRTFHLVRVLGFVPAARSPCSR
jgi:hypothetical protein